MLYLIIKKKTWEMKKCVFFLKKKTPEGIWLLFLKLILITIFEKSEHHFDLFENHFCYINLMFFIFFY